MTNMNDYKSASGQLRRKLNDIDDVERVELLESMSEILNPMTQPVQRAEVTCKIHAKYLLPNLNAYRRPRAPIRPAMFYDLSDDKIIDMLRVARMTNPPTHVDRQRLEWFGCWRGDIIKHEFECESRLLCLLRAAASFKRNGDNGNVYNIMMFASTEYGFHMTEPPMDPIEQNHIAKKYARRRALMSDQLMEENYRTAWRKDLTTNKPTQVGMVEII